MKKIEFQVEPLDIGQRVDVVIAQRFSLSRSLVKKFEDSLYVNQKKVKLSYILKANDQVFFSYEEPQPIPPLSQEDISVPIVYQDEWLLVVNKPYGMVVHPAKGNWNKTLMHALYNYLPKEQDPSLRPGLVHRLDKDTSGLMVLAKDIKTQNALMQIFKKREIEKYYTALVVGRLKHSTGQINYPIARHPKNRLKFWVSESGKEARTDYRVKKEYAKATLVAIQIHTGRTHQIRVHFAFLGNPVVGDKLYSSSYKEFPMCLCATGLSFIHPYTGKKLDFEIPLPDYFEQTIDYFNSKNTK